MTKEAFLSEYRAFMDDAGYTVFSADQYVSYLRNACKKLAGITDHLEQIAAADGNADLQTYYAEQMNIAIMDGQNADACPVSKRQLANYKSAVSLLIAFLSGKAWEKGKGTVALAPLHSASEYTRKDLRRIFLSRLKTQDRMSYAYGVFAARVLCKIAASHRVKLFNKTVENVKFLYTPDGRKHFRLKEIEKLVIATDGYAYVVKEGKPYPLYTEVYRGGKAVGFEAARVITFRDLSLDHDTPMFTALQAALPHMPEYGKLSVHIRHFKQRHPKLNASDFSRAYMQQEYPQLQVCETAILDEVGRFLQAMQLTIMYTPYNSSKNKN